MSYHDEKPYYVEFFLAHFMKNFYFGSISSKYNAMFFSHHLPHVTWPPATWNLKCKNYGQVGYPWKELWKCSSAALTLPAPRQFFNFFLPNYSPPDHNLGQILNCNPARSYFPFNTPTCNWVSVCMFYQIKSKPHTSMFISLSQNTDFSKYRLTL